MDTLRDKHVLRTCGTRARRRGRSGTARPRPRPSPPALAGRRADPREGLTDAHPSDRRRRLYRRDHGPEARRGRPRRRRPRHRLLPPRLAVRRPPHPSQGGSKDLRDVTEDDLAGFDAVVHLSELSNDPIGENDPELTMAINHRGSVGLAEKARGGRRQALRLRLLLLDLRRRRRRDAHRGERPRAADRLRQVQDPRGARRPRLADDRFTPVFMRNATAYGASPRQRFDIVLNNLCGFAHTIGEIRMTSRRLAVAADRPHRGHLPGDALRARRRPRGGLRRGLQRRLRRRQLPHPRDRRDRRRAPSRAASSPSANPAATPAATGSASPRSASTCPTSRPPGPPSAAPASSRRSSTASASPARCSRPSPTPG